MSFTDSGYTLKRIYISYEDLKKAYKDVFECIKERPGWNEYMLLEFKPIDVHKKAYPSEVESLVTKIKYYLSSQMSEEDYYKEFIYMNWGKKECYPGIKMNKAVLKLARELKDRFMNLGESCEKYTLFGQYHPLHSYSEFHKGLFARIRYFVSDNEYYDINNQVLIAYKEVVELCEKIRLCYMKIGVLKNRKKDTEIINTLNSIISYAEAVYRREPVILGRIIGLLEHAHV